MRDARSTRSRRHGAVVPRGLDAQVDELGHERPVEVAGLHGPRDDLLGQEVRAARRSDGASRDRGPPGGSAGTGRSPECARAERCPRSSRSPRDAEGVEGVPDRTGPPRRGQKRRSRTSPACSRKVTPPSPFGSRSRSAARSFEPVAGEALQAVVARQAARHDGRPDRRALGRPQRREGSVSAVPQHPRESGGRPRLNAFAHDPRGPSRRCRRGRPAGAASRARSPATTRVRAASGVGRRASGTHRRRKRRRARREQERCRASAMGRRWRRCRPPPEGGRERRAHRGAGERSRVDRRGWSGDSSEGCSHSRAAAVTRESKSRVVTQGRPSRGGRREAARPAARCPAGRPATSRASRRPPTAGRGKPGGRPPRGAGRGRG